MNAVLDQFSGMPSVPPSVPPSLPPDISEDDSGFVKPWMVAVLVMLVLGALGWWAYKSMGTGHSGPKRQTVKIAVLPDTPPPPPPPKDEKKPEPEKQESKPQPQDQPKPVEAPPAPQQLKMDGPAGDGPSAFAAGQVSSEYKGGDVGAGVGGGTVNKMQFAFFTSRLTRHIQSELAKRSAFKGIDYKVNVKVWLSPGGDFQRVELAASTGDENTDKLLREALGQIPSVDKVPADMPQPLTLRITNRMTG